MALIRSDEWKETGVTKGERDEKDYEEGSESHGAYEAEWGLGGHSGEEVQL